MSVHLEKCPSARCGHLFEVEQFSQAFGPGRVAGVIACPHCGHRSKGNPRLVYVGRKMTRELEEWPDGDMP